MESRRKSTKSADMLGADDIAFKNSTLVFSLMHLFLTETDLDSVVGEISVQNTVYSACIIIRHVIFWSYFFPRTF